MSLPNIQSGEPVFTQTCAGKNLFDYLKKGHLSDQLFDNFPSASKHQAIQATL